LAQKTTEKARCSKGEQRPVSLVRAYLSPTRGEGTAFLQRPLPIVHGGESLRKKQKKEKKRRKKLGSKGGSGSLGQKYPEGLVDDKQEKTRRLACFKRGGGGKAMNY